MPGEWTITRIARGYRVCNGNRTTMLYLPWSLTPAQIQETVWLHYSYICGGGIGHAT